MTPTQIKMMRHALGLDAKMTSYRNRYFAGERTIQETEWLDLVERGYAERTSLCFCVTEAGAKLVLREGEKLDTEDFPQRSPQKDAANG